MQKGNNQDLTEVMKKIECKEDKDISEWLGRNDYSAIFYFSLIPKEIRKCEICGKVLCYNDTVIHHKNGHHRDNRRENLQLLCRTCHTNLHRLQRIPKKHIQTISRDRELLTIYRKLYTIKVKT